jgi:hypothetical protein
MVQTKEMRRANDKCPPREICRPSTNSGEAKSNHDEEKDPIPPIGDELVFAHHLHVVVIQTALDGFGANPNLLTMKEEDMHEHCSDGSKCETVGQCKCG